jgi:BirA family biotin operon repressor/biotin-[acetyl-CoA-carboxylase] ligase
VTDTLDDQAIRVAVEAIVARSWAAPIVIKPETGSTNDDVKALAREGGSPGCLVVADTQTHGRGRSGAVWHSPPGRNLYLSLLLRPELPPAAIVPFTLVVGSVVRDVAQRRLPVPVSIKWPNDVLCRDAKLAGILVEGQVRGEILGSIVVGIGVNVHERAFPPPLDATATSLAIEGAAAGALSRNAIAAELAAGVSQAADRFVRDGFATFAATIDAHDALRGRLVSVNGVSGTASGIDASGSLVIEGEDGARRAVTSGHVELLPR